MKFRFFREKKTGRFPAIAAALALGLFIGLSISLVLFLRPAPVPPALDPDGDQLFASLEGPFISRKEIDSQDNGANDLLHCRELIPSILPDGTKAYDLTASAFPWQLYNTARVNAWGYNGRVPGPLIRLKVGEKVRITVKNKLPQATTIHWHGLAVPNDEDGVPGITQAPIPPGGEFTYRFTVTPQMAGTHLYHTHFNDSFQMDMGLHGVLLVDPQEPDARAFDVEALYEMASFKVGGSDQENVFTLNGKAFPEAPVLRVTQGSRVLLHLVNASGEQSHVMHLHGYTFRIIALDGNRLDRPIAANTVNLAPSQTADVVFKADNPGKWMFHCHIVDHMINPGPQGEGDAETPANMGGLMTLIEVVPRGKAENGYLAAGSLYSKMSCNR